ncbi:hypothetical protein GCM10009788_34050 [Nocardioides humi]|uniref:Alpha-tubulin suppressor-like RCC1 family protein n=1 Tax=Nocardioides humi TaxID=449461 RepID=A0ABN2AXP1_9ACTN
MAMRGAVGRRSARRLRVGGVAAVTAALTVSLVTAAPAGADPASAVGGQNLPVPLERAGGFVGWGSPGDALTPPASLDGVALREVALTAETALALTGDGRVVVWGVDGQTNVIPASVGSLDVVDLAASSINAGVVTRDGRVVVWGASSSTKEDPTDVPAGLSGVTQLAIAHTSAFALKDDGSVVAWGRQGDLGVVTGVLEVPDGLRASAISAADFNAYALTTDGTVAGWGRWGGGGGDSNAPLPAATQIPGNVTAVAAIQQGGVALLADGSITAWGLYGAEMYPDLGGKRAVAIAGGLADAYAVLDEDGVLHFGGPGAVDPALVSPAEVVGAPVAQFAVGGGQVGVIQTEMLRGSAPTVAGTARVGSVLTATPGTFSGEPDEVSSRWLADGQPIGDPASGTAPASLTLGADLAGKRISYESTATKDGVEPVVSTSVQTAAVSVPPPPVPAKVASMTAVTKVKIKKAAKKVMVKGAVNAAASPAGQAQVSIVKGKKTIVTATVPVAADGSFKLVAKKFGKKAIKKTKAKNKATGYRGKYQVTVTYDGNGGVSASSGAATFKVKK